MASIGRECRGLIALAILLGLPGLAFPQVGGAPAAATAEPEFVYRFRTRDTLIQVCRRLLVQPQRWPEVQRRNAIANPFSIPPDTPVRIPYSWLRLTPDTAVVQAVAGTVTRDGAPVLQGDVLSHGMRIETAANGSVSILFADQSVVTLQRSSVLRLERLQNVTGAPEGHSAELQLESGRAETQVKPKRDVGRFEIVTPVAISAVRGTQFRTGFDPASGAAVTETLEGRVGVGASQGAVAVDAGFGTRVETSGTVLAPVPLLPPPDLGALATASTRPQLRIEFPALPGATSYRVQLAPDEEFLTVLAETTGAMPAAAFTLAVDGDYWVRARGIDSRGIEGADATRRLAHHLLPPEPTLQSPAEGARIFEDEVEIGWESTDAAAYRLQIARDAAFADLVADRTLASGNGEKITGLSTGYYHWRVAGMNARGETGAWSAARGFARRNRPPVPEAVRADRRELFLTWPVSAGDRYRLQVARDVGFKRLVTDTVLTKGEFRLVKPAMGAYHARLQPDEGAGSDAPFGESRQVRIDMPTWLKVLLGSTVVLPALL